MIGVEIPLRGDAAVRLGLCGVWGGCVLTGSGQDLAPGTGASRGDLKPCWSPQGVLGAWTQVPLPRHPCCSALTLPCLDLHLKMLLLK